LILLSSINYENTEMVLRRITDNFKRDNPNLAVKLVTSNQPIVIPL
jgi:hypothetical protein